MRVQGENIYTVSMTQYFLPQTMTLFKMHLSNPQLSTALAIPRPLPGGEPHELASFSSSRVDDEWQDEFGDEQLDEVRLIAGARRIVTP